MKTIYQTENFYVAFLTDEKGKAQDNVIRLFKKNPEGKDQALGMMPVNGEANAERVKNIACRMIDLEEARLLPEVHDISGGKKGLNALFK